MKRKTFQEWEKILSSAMNQACGKIGCKHHKTMPDTGLPFYLVPFKEESRRKAK